MVGRKKVCMLESCHETLFCRGAGFGDAGRINCFFFGAGGGAWQFMMIEESGQWQSVPTPDTEMACTFPNRLDLFVWSQLALFRSPWIDRCESRKAHLQQELSDLRSLLPLSYEDTFIGSGVGG